MPELPTERAADGEEDSSIRSFAVEDAAAARWQRQDADSSAGHARPRCARDGCAPNTAERAGGAMMKVWCGVLAPRGADAQVSHPLCVQLVGAGVFQVVVLLAGLE